VLNGAKRRREMAWRGDGHGCPSGAARNVNKKHRNGNQGEYDCVYRDHHRSDRTRGNAKQRQTNQELAAAHWRHAAPRQEIAEPAANNSSHDSKEEWDGSEDAHFRDTHVPFVFEIERQPTDIEPERVNRPKETADHAPGCPVSK